MATLISLMGFKADDGFPSVVIFQAKGPEEVVERVRQMFAEQPALERIEIWREGVLRKALLRTDL